MGLAWPGVEVEVSLLNELVYRSVGVNNSWIALKQRVSGSVGEQRLETLAGGFGAAAVDGVYRAQGLLLKLEQVVFRLLTCVHQALVTSPAWLRKLLLTMREGRSLQKHVVLTKLATVQGAGLGATGSAELELDLEIRASRVQMSLLIVPTEAETVPSPYLPHPDGRIDHPFNVASWPVQHP